MNTRQIIAGDAAVRRRWLLGTALAGIALSATPAFAQAVGDPAAGTTTEQPSAALAQGAVAAPGEAADTGGLEDIVVTARKRVETTQDVPVSVTALGPAQLQRYDLSNLERVAASTPQFVIGRAPSGSGATLVLRGIGSNTTSIGLEQSVAVVVDGVYYGQGRVINEGFFDLGRLEILKGPQSLFFGKNATAGVVSITTADPTDRREFIGRLGYEVRSQQLIGEAIGSGPLSDTLGIRIGVRATKMYDSFFKNIGNDVIYPTTEFTSRVVTPHASAVGPRDAGKSKDIYGRVTLKWTPTDQFTATLKANAGANDSNNPGASSVLYNCPRGVSQLNPAIRCGRKFVSSSNRVPADIAATLPFAGDGTTGNTYKSWATTLNLNYELDDVTFTSVTNYNSNRNTFIFDGDSVSAGGPVGVYATERSSFKAFSSEFRALTTYDGPINVLVGGYYQSTKRVYNAFTASGGLENVNAPQPFQRYLANSKNSETEGETIAGFGQVTWKIFKNLEAAAGVRYTHETKDSYFIQPYSHPTRVAQGIFLPNVRIAADQTFTNWSPEATLTYKPTRDLTIYGAYKTAYKSGGFSNSGILSPSAGLDDFTFDPEKARGFEGGVKSTLFDRQLRLNLGIYTYKFENLQLDFFNSPVFAFSTINAGSARSRGVELEFEYAPRTLEGLNLRGSLNYNRARYGDTIGPVTGTGGTSIVGPNAPCYTGQAPAAGCTILIPGARPTQNLKGLATANAPLWTASLGASYDFPLSDNLKLSLSTDARYSASYIPTAFGNPNTRQPKYINLDASVRIRTADDMLEFAAIGKNLTNRFYATGGTDAPSTGARTGTVTGLLADQIGFISLPRSVQLQVTVRY
ncbi:TonB-dependent receptor [Sphingomonas profundi]|uniref:TonB-dependent receptor n=1 Tax=Alterirhizorhabdus profundi TaxID=2681549 RepID=UPI0012E79D14|nr:TonB-dependent receptor [Sphingomonas profundi]